MARSAILFLVDDGANPVAREVRLEIIPHRRNGVRLFGLVIGEELGEFLLQQVSLRLELGDKIEDFLQNLAQGEAAVRVDGPSQLVEVVIILGLLEHLAVHVVEHALPFAIGDGGGDGRVFPYGLAEPLEELAVDLHPPGADGLLFDRGEDVLAQVFITVPPNRPVITAITFAAPSALRQLQHFVVVELGLEVFTVGEEIEELERRFLRLLGIGKIS